MVLSDQLSGRRFGGQSSSCFLSGFSLATKQYFIVFCHRIIEQCELEGIHNDLSNSFMSFLYCSAQIAPSARGEAAHCKAEQGMGYSLYQNQSDKLETQTGQQQYDWYTALSLCTLLMTLFYLKDKLKKANTSVKKSLALIFFFLRLFVLFTQCPITV